MDGENETMIESFDTFNRWAKKNLQMDLDGYKEKQLQRRIFNVMSNHDVKNLTEYMRYMEKNAEARLELKNYITINVTEFFRNPELFNALKNQVMTNLATTFNSLKCWSAACSNGSEPYSLAMLFDEENIKLKQKILATDIDPIILSKAKQGLYAKNELKNIDQIKLDTYFTEKEAKFEINPNIKQQIQFKEHDLLQSKFEKDFHLIICRNVTIYFKPETRDELYQKFYDSLLPGGLFFTGATETINQPEKFGFKKIDSFIYKK